VTTFGRSSSVTPMMPTGTPPAILMVNGSAAGSPLSKRTLPPRIGNRAAG
jgi:hypothetical protein